MVPFCESRIDEIERVQSKVAKFALGFPVSFANVCAQTELGMKSFRQQLYERQLKFYFWVFICLGEDGFIKLCVSICQEPGPAPTSTISHLCGKSLAFFRHLQFKVYGKTCI